MLLVIWGLYAFFPRDSENISIPNTGFLGILIYSLLPDKFKLDAFIKFKSIFCLILLISLLEYPLIILGLINNNGTIEPFSDIKIARNQFYIDYVFNVVLNDQHLKIGNLSFFRFSSIFDEPGLIGSICAILFFTYPLKNDHKKTILIQKTILLLSIFLSFSLGGYILFFIGFLLQNLLINRENRLRKITVTSILIVITLSILATTEGGKKYITDRIWNNDGITITKNNREDVTFNSLYEKMYINPKDALFGYGKDSHVRTKADVSSYKGFIYNYGLIGLCLIILTF
ncbi:hypothetical protein, partial [Providencia sp. wls1950]|uniref:hypothetical protein n=1 Tax=Providencia sp. wls1950 TaxID=2675147 RepID=UPI0012B5F328